MATNPNRTNLETELARLVKIREEHGTIGRPDYTESLERLGRAATSGAVGGLRKQVAALLPASPPASKDFEMGEAEHVALAASRTLEDFYVDHVLPEHPALTFASFYRRYTATTEPGLRALVQPGRHGMESFRRAVLSCLWHCERFGQAWQADVVTLPFKVVPPGKGRRYPVPVDMVGIIDDATRLIVGWKLVPRTEGRAVRATDVADTLIGAMHRWGVPEQFVMDNGKEFDNAVVARLLKLSASTARLTPRYRGESKGKIERFNRTVVGWFAREYATWTAGPPSAARYPIQGGSETGAPTYDEAMERLAYWIDWYNNTKVHSAHGLTPADARSADPTVLFPLDLHKVLHLGTIHNLGSKDQFVDVQKYGINHDRRHWTCLDPHSPGRRCMTGPQSLASMLGSRHGVRIRKVNGDDTVIGVYDADDKFVCLATRMDLVPTDHKVLNGASNQAVLRYAEKVLADAHDEIAGRTAGTAPTGTSAARRGALTVTAKLAGLLNTEHTQIRQASVKVIDADGNLQLCRALTVDDDTVPSLDVDTAIRALQIWTDHEVQNVYRLELANQVLDYDTASAAARLIDRVTGEVEVHIPLRFADAV